ncbi:hypothetical protein EXV95_17475 [Acidovorax sp. JMULE5]|uniref:hypothetical protein n=1 Tax=Acidovorax sp. JMULE5 TaxID=2518343 RepID=UPI0015A3E557|nr:hypothetical protein [Acidovorax sp. JMULE5]QLA82270.1 hypothetical protein EXV95_17475 [Acidovorax sp. JMULE5]
MLHDDETGLITYLLADLEAREAVLIDPRPADAGVIHAMLSEHHLQPVAVVHTDDHPVDGQPAPVQPPGHASWPAATRLNDGETLAFGAQHLRCLGTPGHTWQGRSYLWRDRLFCGGVLSPWLCPEAAGVDNPAQLWESIMARVFRQPAETLLFPGHSCSGWTVSNVFTQRKHHPWLSSKSRDEALQAIAQGPLHDNLQPPSAPTDSE